MKLYRGVAAVYKPLSGREAALAAADARLLAARQAFAHAALACLAGRSDAEELVRGALRDVDLARAGLLVLVDDATEDALLPAPRPAK